MKNLKPTVQNQHRRFTKLRKFVLGFPPISFICSSPRSRQDLIRENEELKAATAALSLENECLRKLLDSSVPATVKSPAPAHLKKPPTDLELGPGHITVAVLPTVSYSLFQHSSSSLPLKLDTLDSKRRHTQDWRAFRWAKVSNLDALTEEDETDEYVDVQEDASSIDLIVPNSTQTDRQLMKLPERNGLLHPRNSLSPGNVHMEMSTFDPPDTILGLDNPMMRSVTTAAGPSDLSACITRDSVYPVHGGGYADVYSGILSRDEKTPKVTHANISRVIIPLNYNRITGSRQGYSRTYFHRDESMEDR